MTWSWHVSSQSGRRASFPEFNLTGRVFGYMVFQFAAPDRLKCPAASIQGIHLCKVCMLTPQVTPFNPMRGNARVSCHLPGIALVPFNAS